MTAGGDGDSPTLQIADTHPVLIFCSSSLLETTTNQILSLKHLTKQLKCY